MMAKSFFDIFNGIKSAKKSVSLSIQLIPRSTVKVRSLSIYYGTVTGGGLAIIKNLSLEGEPFQAFLMERVPIVSDL